nr:hypothetical protein EUX21_02665 [synthetic Caulobacter sp. 'ethensis']
MQGPGGSDRGRKVIGTLVSFGQFSFPGRLIVVDQHDPGVRRQSCSVKTILGLAFAILLAIRPLLVAAVAQW